MLTDKQTDRQTGELTGYPSIDKPWLKYYTEQEINTALPEITLYQNIWNNNKDHLNDISLMYFGKKISYGELFEAVDDCMMALYKRGVRAGDCITLYSSSTPEAVILVLACNKLGVLANFLNPLFTTEQTIARINDTGANYIFILDKLLDRCLAALSNTSIKEAIVIPVYQSMPQPLKTFAKIKSNKLVKPSNGIKVSSWTAFIDTGKGFSQTEYSSLEKKYEKDEPAVMVYSSGTTGASKGIVLTNDGINATLSNYLDTGFECERGYSFLQMIPIWFSTGIIVSVMMPLAMGMYSILEPVFSKESFAKDLAKYKPNLTIGATSLWKYAIRCRELRDTDFSNMKFPISGGEAIRPQDLKEIKEFLLSHGCTSEFAFGYGMCELGSTATTTTALYHGKPGSAGVPLLHARVAAFNPDSNAEMKYNERGEIRVDTPAMMKGYYKNVQATNDFFYYDSEGTKWGCTGDIGYVDEDGDVFVLGRASDSYLADNGSRVYNFDAEEVLLKDDRISACKVLGVMTKSGMRSVAHIVLRDGETASFKDVVIELNKMCVARLPEYCVPVAYKQRDSFPVHSNGKRDVESLLQERDGFIDVNGIPLEIL